MDTPTADTVLIQQLALYRYEHDLSYSALARLMTAAGYRMHPRSLSLALTGDLRVGPYDRTLWKIREFLLYCERVDSAVGRRKERTAKLRAEARPAERPAAARPKATRARKRNAA